MPLLKVNALTDRPVLDGSGDPNTHLREALQGLSPAAPVIILIHGYKSSPFRPGFDPHDHILSLTPRKTCRKAISWPRHLEFGRGKPDEGLCIAFGWHARGTIWQAWNEADAAGRALAALIGGIGQHSGRPVHLMAHSLGARVALNALHDLPENSVGRVILLAAAEYRSAATRALQTPAGRSAEVINVTSRENDLFDVLVECLLRPKVCRDVALGSGLPGHRNWLDIQLDAPATLEALLGLGHRIPGPERRICHWSSYLRPGVFGLYSRLLREPRQLPLPLLRNLLPATPEPRWSRLLTQPAIYPHLSFGRFRRS